jgi:uncharacterized protein
VAGATTFYSALFGWEPDERPVGDGITYTMMRLDGRDVCGLSRMSDAMAASGAPPSWTSYVSVESADAAAARAESLGGTAMAPAFDVLDAGRMALLRDPQGAVFAVWEPRSHIGAGVVNEPGSLTLNQLNTSDTAGAARFYGELFGWEVSQVATEPTAYWGIHNAGALNGGMMALDPSAPAPPHWLPYFTAADLDEALFSIGASGGQVMLGPMTIESGQIAVARDPQGAYFALFAGRVDP